MSLYFEEDGRRTVLERARIIAEAEVVSRRRKWASGRGVTVSAPMQKAVLFTMMPYEGQKISHEAIAQRIGISWDCCAHAVTVLIEAGLLRRGDGPRCKARSYAIDYDALLKLAAPQPHLVKSGRHFGSPFRKVKATA